MNDEPTFTFSDKFMFIGLVVDISVLITHDYGFLPTPIEWAGIGMAWGCIIVALIDALRRFFDLW